MLRIDGPVSAATAYKRKWRAANPAKVHAITLRWAEQNRAQIRTYMRDRHYRKKFGITAAQRNAMIAAVGRCGICAKPFGESKDTHIDHDHATGTIRGMLCSSCNRRLGWYEKWRIAVDAYLASPPIKIPTP